MTPETITAWVIFLIVTAAAVTAAAWIDKTRARALISRGAYNTRTAAVYTTWALASAVPLWIIISSNA